MMINSPSLKHCFYGFLFEIDYAVGFPKDDSFIPSAQRIETWWKNCTLILVDNFQNLLLF